MKGTTRNIAGLMVICVVSLFLASCTTTPRKTDNTPAKTFEASFDDVYEASINAFRNLGLEIFKRIRDQGYVEGGRRESWPRGSERVGVFIERTDPAKTTVRIDSRKAFVGYAFAKDWTDELFDQIELELHRMRRWRKRG
ncbi:MAG: hypothetical protein ACE5HC_14080 [Candidatus Binatia bacterium]